MCPICRSFGDFHSWGRRARTTLTGHLLDTCWTLAGHLLDTCWTFTGHPRRRWVGTRIEYGQGAHVADRYRGWSNRRVRGERRESVGGWHMGDCSTCVRVCQMSELSLSHKSGLALSMGQVYV